MIAHVYKNAIFFLQVIDWIFIVVDFVLIDVYCIGVFFNDFRVFQKASAFSVGKYNFSFLIFTTPPIIITSLICTRIRDACEILS